MKHKALILLVVFCAVFALFQMGFAEVSSEEAAKLKSTLTPLGAEKAGNKEGTIPAWDGGLTTVPPGFKNGDPHPDPFADEKPLFTITSQNMSQYEDKIDEGSQFLLKKYPSYRMDVYPSHRTAAAPQYVYDNTFQNATRAKLTNNGLSVEGAYGGIPFPIPKNGNEVMFNHLLSWKGEAAYEDYSIWLIKGDSTVLAVEAENFQQWPYYYKDVPIDKWNGYYWYLRQLSTAPPFKAGECILIKDPVDLYGEGRQAWQYLVGQRRTRRAPSISYDTPDFVSSGQIYFDEAFLFNGALDRYQWKLVGKKEMFIPYNCNKSGLGKIQDVMGREYVNPDYVRWELHRVWVVDATLAPAKRHVVPKRRFYLDEDTWGAALSIGWDGHGKLWRYIVSLMMAMPEIPATLLTSNAVYNLETGMRTYFACDLWKDVPGWPETFFTPASLAGTSVR